MTAVLLRDELWTNYDNIKRFINKDDRQRLSSSLQQVDFTSVREKRRMEKINEALIFSESQKTFRVEGAKSSSGKGHAHACA